MTPPPPAYPHLRTPFRYIHKMWIICRFFGTLPLYLAMVFSVFVQQFLIFVCTVARTCNTLILAVYEFAGVHLAAILASEVTFVALSVGL